MLCKRAVNRAKSFIKIVGYPTFAPLLRMNMKKYTILLPMLALMGAASLSFVAPPPGGGPEIPADIQTLLSKHGCQACHAMDRKLVGPKWTDVAAKGYNAKRIMALVAKPEPNNWPGYPPMAAQNVPKGELSKIANWLVSMKK